MNNFFAETFSVKGLYINKVCRINLFSVCINNAIFCGNNLIKYGRNIKIYILVLKKNH